MKTTNLKIGDMFFYENDEAVRKLKLKYDDECGYTFSVMFSGNEIIIFSQETVDILIAEKILRPTQY